MSETLDARISSALHDGADQEALSSLLGEVIREHDTAANRVRSVGPVLSKLIDSLQASNDNAQPAGNARHSG